MRQLVNDKLGLWFERLHLLEPNSFTPLNTHVDKILCVVLTDIARTLYLKVTPFGFKFIEQPTAPYNATLTTTAVQLASPQGAGQVGAFQFEGDIHLAQGLQHFIQNCKRPPGDIIEIFFNHTLAKWSYPLQQKLKTPLPWKEMLSAYVQREVALLPTRAHFSEFQSSLQRLNEGIDRLQARINRLTESSE